MDDEEIFLNCREKYTKKFIFKIVIEIQNDRSK
jgi:uncharacterized membrane protein